MANANPARCTYSAAGHMRHPIQRKLAFNAGPPVTVQIMGEHATGFTVAPVDSPTHVEVWCMHQEWRDVIGRALDEGITTLLSYEYGLARIGEEYISHTTPEAWIECPKPGDLLPWQKGLVTREQLLQLITESGSGKTDDA